MLTLNWNEARTWNEGQVRDYFAAKGWALSGDDAQLGETQFRLVDFGKANCLNFVAPLEELPQDVYDFIFRQLELSIREIGYGDQSINKKMKDYINLFYAMLDKIHDWDLSSFENKTSVLETFLDNNAELTYLTKYFDKYSKNLSNNTLNLYIKGVIKS